MEDKAEISEQGNSRFGKSREARGGWFRIVAGIPVDADVNSQDTAIDLCKLDTQYNKWAEKYNSSWGSAREVEGAVPDENEDKVQDDDEDVEIQLSWRGEFNTQATLLCNLQSGNCFCRADNCWRDRE
jgi:hypothetical protein